ncbi:uncharacterized protein LOC123311950 isoform X2 [Coccinella septempunctata]|uniref:uncharacterized protein LOC123311950 isoform X2 n=1 Tax=Coccinella septempunctata TaxID=41139 RepID=UPI001D08C77E|nr:uncharacterized protein LOC123311950 isoform X2 [Coccinella septempunctata]
MAMSGVFVPIFINFKFSNIIGFTLHHFNHFYGEKPLKLRSTYIIRIIMLTMLMLVPYMEYLKDEFHESSTTVKLLALVCGMRVIGCIGILVSDLHNQMYLIEATKYLNSVDEELMKFGKHVSYKSYSRLLLVGGSSVFFCVISSRVLFVIAGEPFWTVVIDFFITGYPFLILNINTLYLMFFLFVIRKRFTSLMSIVNDNRRKFKESQETESLLKMFLKMSQMYNDLYYCANSINKFVSLASFICVMCNLLEAMLVANLMYQGEGSFKDIYSVGTYLWLTLSTLLSPMFVEEMPGKFCRIVTGIEISDTHKELQYAQFSFCISLVLVMYQIAG